MLSLFGIRFRAWDDLGRREGEEAMRFSVCVLFVALISGACGGKDNPVTPSGGSSGGTTNPPPSSSASSLTFRVDGTAHTATSVTAGLSSGILSIGGTD